MTDQTRPGPADPDDQTAPTPEGKLTEARKGPPTASGAGGPSGGPAGGEHEELPYIDDPISKWWIGVVVAVFVLIFAWAVLFGVGGVFEGALGGDEPAETPEPTLMASPSPEASPSVTPEPTIGMTPEPTAEAEPTAEPEPTTEVTATPEAEPTAEPEPTLQPTSTPVPVATRVPSTSTDSE